MNLRRWVVLFGMAMIATGRAWAAGKDDISVNLYLDPWTVRKEIIVNSRLLEAKITEGTAIDREAVGKELQALLVDKMPLWIDGEQVDFEPGPVRFLERQQWNEPIERKDLANLDFEMLQVAMESSAPLPALDSKVRGEWRWFPQGMTGVMVKAAWPGGWDEFATAPGSPAFEVRYELPPDARAAPRPPPVPPLREMSVPWPSGLFLLGALVLFWIGTKSKMRWAKVGAAVCLIAAVASWFTIRPVIRIASDETLVVSEEEAEEICERLLEGIYHGFQIHDEAAQYDVLEGVLAGAALEETFLEARRTREARERDDTRVAIREVAVMGAKPEGLTDAPGFSARCKWRTLGLVGHWGHFHERRNRYQAELRVEIVGGAWKATTFELGTRERE